MREIRAAKLDKTRPVVVLTRATAWGMGRVSVAPITSTVRGLLSEVSVGPRNGLDHDSVISLDNITTITRESLGRLIGYLHDDQEAALVSALLLTYDLELPQ